jgi:hypothetical protein
MNEHVVAAGYGRGLEPAVADVLRHVSPMS